MKDNEVNPFDAIFGNGDPIKDMINKMFFEVAVKPQVEAELNRLKAVADDLLKNGNYVVVQTTIGKLKNKEKIIFRGSQIKCMNIWSDLFDTITAKKKFRVQEIETINPDNSLVFGKIIIE